MPEFPARGRLFAKTLRASVNLFCVLGICGVFPLFHETEVTAPLAPVSLL